MRLIPISRPFHLSLLTLLALVVALPTTAEEGTPEFRPVRDYRLAMEVNLMAPFPFLQRFGAVNVVGKT